MAAYAARGGGLVGGKEGLWECPAPSCLGPLSRGHRDETSLKTAGASMATSRGGFHKSLLMTEWKYKIGNWGSPLSLANRKRF